MQSCKALHFTEPSATRGSLSLQGLDLDVLLLARAAAPFRRVLAKCDKVNWPGYRLGGVQEHASSTL